MRKGHDVIEKGNKTFIQKYTLDELGIVDRSLSLWPQIQFKYDFSAYLEMSFAFCFQLESRNKIVMMYL